MRAIADAPGKKRGKTPTRPNTPNGSKITTCSPRSQNAKANADVNFADRARIASHSKREWRASERAKNEEASDVKNKESGDAPGKETKTGASPYPQKLLKTLFGSSISAGCMSEGTNRFNPCGKGRDAPVKKRKPTRPRFYGIVGDAPVRGKPNTANEPPTGSDFLVYDSQPSGRKNPMVTLPLPGRFLDSFRAFTRQQGSNSNLRMPWPIRFSFGLYLCRRCSLNDITLDRISGIHIAAVIVDV